MNKHTKLIAITLSTLTLVGCGINIKTPEEKAHEQQQIVHSQIANTGYDDFELQSLYRFTDFRQTGRSVALTHDGVVEPEGLTKVNEVLLKQKESGMIADYELIKSYAISSGKSQQLYPKFTVLITLPIREE